LRISPSRSAPYNKIMHLAVADRPTPSGHKRARHRRTTRDDPDRRHARDGRAISPPRWYTSKADATSRVIDFYADNPRLNGRAYSELLRAWQIVSQNRAYYFARLPDYRRSHPPRTRVFLAYHDVALSIA